MDVSQLTVFAADVGSVSKGRFGWASCDARGIESGPPGTALDDLVVAVSQRLSHGVAVALGFECPLFIPLPETPSDLGRSRPGEGARAWSAQAGAITLALGAQQVTWILRAIRERTPAGTSFHLRWPDFAGATSGLFLWEAFVSQAAKGVDHGADALIAARFFAGCLPTPEAASLPSPPAVLSLLGAALIRSGWTEDARLLSEPCLVFRAL